MSYYKDKIIKCRRCGRTFTWTASEQEFYASHGLNKEPAKCRRCREEKKNGGRERVMYEIVCAKCGKVDGIPIEPSHSKPVYCRDCFKKPGMHR